MKEYQEMLSKTLMSINKNPRPEDRSFQQVVQTAMKQMAGVGGFESIYLFSEEGLMLAHVIDSERIISQVRATECAVIINKVKRVVQKMTGLHTLKEICIEDVDYKRLVFRFINIFEQSVILLIVVPAHKSYRGLANRLTQVIEKTSSEGT